MQGLGLAIGASLMDLKKATTLASVTVMTFMLAGGYFVKVSHKLPQVKSLREIFILTLSDSQIAVINTGFTFLQNVPIFISWLRYLSFNYHTYKLLLKVHYGDIIQQIDGMKIDNGIMEVCALAGMVVGYRLLAYLSLRRMNYHAA